MLLPCCRKSRTAQAGFSLLELVVAFAVAALLIAVVAPGAYQFYESTRYRSAVGDLQAALATARYRAITRGQPVDLEIQPDSHRFRVDGRKYQSVTDKVTLSVIAAAELSPDGNTAVIRFYPDGSSSGGNLAIERTNGGVVLDVDWLMGRVSQRPLEH